MTSENPSTEVNDLQRLAMHMAVNHVRWDIPNADWKHVLQHQIKNARQRRTIAVVGSGASAAAGLPLTTEAIEKLSQKLKIGPDILRQETERLELIHGFAPGEFETALLALSNIIYPPERVRDALHELYSRRYQPLLVYEILAHMLKHRYLDAIINFNFDELLDQAVADELAPHEYYYIVHDGDCPEATGNPTIPYELPVYMKPHGTASHKSSLRFTREAYYGIPREIQRVMHDLLFGMPVTLLVVGFSMQSLEFNRLLERSPSARIHVFFLNHEKPVPGIQLDHGLDEYLIKVNRNGSPTLDDRMREIWHEVDSAFRAPYYAPRDIKRHELICNVFAGSEGSPVPQAHQAAHLTQYLHDRTLVELALSMANAKGLINMSVISHDRCGQYYDLYHSAARPQQELLYKMCLRLGLQDIGYSRDALRLTKPEPGGDRWILDEELFRQKVLELSAHIVGFLSPQYQEAMINLRHEFEDTLMELYRNKEVELRGQADQLHNKIFENPKIIRTLTGLSYETLRLLEKQHWDKLYIVAETGEWLIADNIIEILSQKEASIRLVVADTSFVKKLKRRLGDKLEEPRSLPWWNHNRHLTLTLSRGIPKDAIYFTRRLRSPNINPVVLAGDDATVAHDAFLAYWHKAKKSSPWISPEELLAEELLEDN